jgi:hypothetical protein
VGRQARSRIRGVLELVLFGSVLVAFYFLVFRGPWHLDTGPSPYVAVNVAATVVCASLAAYLCRRVVRALLRLVGL